MSDEKKMGPWSLKDLVTPVMNHDKYEGMPGRIVNFDWEHGWRLWVEMLDGEVLYVDPDDIDSFAKSSEESALLEKIEELEGLLLEQKSRAEKAEATIRIVRRMLTEAIQEFGGGHTAEGFDHNEYAVSVPYPDDRIVIDLPYRRHGFVEGAFLPHYEVKEDGEVIQNFDLKTGEELSDLVEEAKKLRPGSPIEIHGSPTPQLGIRDYPFMKEPMEGLSVRGGIQFPRAEMDEDLKGEAEMTDLNEAIINDALEKKRQSCIHGEVEQGECVRCGTKAEDIERIEDIEYDDGGNPR